MDLLPYLKHDFLCQLDGDCSQSPELLENHVNLYLQFFLMLSQQLSPFQEQNILFQYQDCRPAGRTK